MRNDPLFDQWQQRVEFTLNQVLPEITHYPKQLHAAMRYAVLGGGKRMRPLLVYATGHLFGIPEARLDAPAAAVELIHAYSLIHDDLPAMDNDTLRRGQPTVHIAFDEATAILAGDALQTAAFETLCNNDAPASLQVAWLRSLTRASGAAGMCGGQALDMAATHGQQNLTQLAQMHALKTGALIESAIEMGAMAGDASATILSELSDFAQALGLAFQVQDDILDIESSAEQLGKTAGKDSQQQKSTYPALLGLDGAKQKLQELEKIMEKSLSNIHFELEDKQEKSYARIFPLTALSHWAVKRNH